MTVLKIRATQLRAAIRPVAPLANGNAGAPTVLAMVRLWTGDGHLYASCTDMVVGGIERTRVDGVEPGFETCVDVADFGRQIDLVAPRGAGYNPTLILEATPGGLVVQSEPYETAHPSATFHLQALDPAKFPKVEDALGRWPTDGDPIADTALRVDVLARFTQAGGGEPLRFRFTGPKRPVIVSGGDSFVGLVMPAALAPSPDPYVPNLWPELFGGDES